MATVQRNDLWFTFTPEERNQMLADDIFAGKSVSSVLIAVITLGMLIGLFTVLAICL